MTETILYAHPAAAWRTLPIQRVEHPPDTKLEPGRVANATDRFVESQNPTQSTLDLAGYVVMMRGAAGAIDSYTTPRRAPRQRRWIRPHTHTPTTDKPGVGAMRYARSG